MPIVMEDWIDINIKKPKKYETIIVTDDIGVGIAQVDDDGSLVKVGTVELASPIKYNMEVTHWMYLPDAPVYLRFKDNIENR